MSRFSENIRGAIFIALSMACFVTNDGIMKSFSGELTLYQAIALRGGIATALCVLLALAVDGRRSLPSDTTRPMIQTARMVATVT